MKGSLTILFFFVAGCLLGGSGYLPDILLENDISIYVLYLLAFLVGISIGADRKLKEILKSISPSLLLVPVATMAGTLTFSALAGLVISKWDIWETMAVGSGFAYYSLSSILISQFKEPSIGAQLAAELGTIALLSNIMREMITLVGTPFFLKYFGRFAPICVGGATTMDTTLPIITKYCGKDMVFIAIFHGILVDFSVPFWVSLFCSL